MPPVIAALAAAAGLFAGARWIALQVARRTEEARATAESMARRARENVAAPRDLGALEFDPEAKVYRPRGEGTE
ncbi:MAG: hypothetical protein ACT4N2_03320 [Hyphomicrobium sp.]